MRRVFILASRRDHGAGLLLTELLARRVPAVPVETERLALARWRWLRAERDLPLVSLPDGREVDPGPGDLLVNRCSLPILPHLASTADRDYALAEIAALWIAWLAALQQGGVTVLNPPCPTNLTGLAAGNPVWRQFARSAGLEPAPQLDACPARAAPRGASGRGGWRATETVLACCGRTQPQGPGAAAVRRLSELAGTPLLSVLLARDGDGYRFVDADPAPDLDRRAVGFLAARLAELTQAEEAPA